MACLPPGIRHVFYYLADFIVWGPKVPFSMQRHAPFFWCERCGKSGCDVVSLPLAITVLRKDTCPSPVLGVCACVSNNVDRSPSAHVRFSYLQLSMYYLYTYIYMYLHWLPGPGLLSLTMYYVKLLTKL